MGPDRNGDRMLLISILIAVVLIAVILLLFVQSHPADDDHDDVPEQYLTPKPSATTTLDWKDDNFELYFNNISDWVRSDNVKYQLLDRNRIPVEQGELNDVYNKLLRDPMNGSILTNISWRDSDGDDRLSDGDTIILMSTENDRWNDEPADPGIAEAGMIFRLIYDPNEHTICSIELK